MKHASALRQAQNKMLMDLLPMSIAYEERVLPVTSFHEGSVPQKELERTVCVSGNTKATWRAQEQLLPHSAMWVVTTLSSALVLRADRQFFCSKTHTADFQCVCRSRTALYHEILFSVLMSLSFEPSQTGLVPRTETACDVDAMSQDFVRTCPFYPRCDTS